MVQLYSLWGNPPIKYSDYLKKKGSVYTMDIIEKIRVVQHVRLADGFDGGVHCRDGRMEQSGDFGGGHPHVVTGYADRLVLYDDYVTFHGSSFLDGATCKFLDVV